MVKKYEEMASGDVLEQGAMNLLWVRNDIR